MGSVYVKGGTPVGSASLCETCTSATIIRGYRESEVVTICTEVHPNLRLVFPVQSCTGYWDKNRPDWEQMEKLAIDVDFAPIKKVKGFLVGVDDGNDE